MYTFLLKDWIWQIGHLAIWSLLELAFSVICGELTAPGVSSAQF